MFATTIAGSLPKPSWLAEPDKLWPAWSALNVKFASGPEDDWTKELRDKVRVIAPEWTAGTNLAFKFDGEGPPDNWHPRRSQLLPTKLRRQAAAPPRAPLAGYLERRVWQ